GIDVHTEDIAVADGEDFRLRSGPIDEGIVGRNGAVVAEAEHFASEARGILGCHGSGGGRITTGADVHIDHAVAAEDDPRAAATAGDASGIEILPVADTGAVPAKAGEGEAVGF